MFQKSPLALLISCLLTPTGLYADDTTEQTESEHEHKYERILVTASPLEKSALDSSQPIHVLSNDDLRQAQAATLGETLRGIPGVQTSYFGPTASSPIIRGLDGPRVKIVQNGLDAADLSRGGPDHAGTTESTTAQQIEVFRGPATLLFGSGASGGVVNVVDNRVPRYAVQGVTGYYGAGYSTVANERHASAGVDAGQGNFAVHLDAYKRKNNDYKVPLFLNEEQELSKKIDNSFTDDHGYNFGSSYFFDNGFLGVSYGYMERDYGLPGHSHHHDEEKNEGHGENSQQELAHDDVFAHFKQDRYQVLGSFSDPLQGIKRFDLNLGFTQLKHHEIEDHVIETGFALEQTELRLTAAHTALWGWDGAFGVQLQQQKYTASGTEAFTPASDTDLAGVFWLLEKNIGAATFETGLRIEEVRINTEHQARLKYTPVSASFGVNYQASTALIYSLSLSYSERAPQTSELFSNGAHFATRSYELGGFYHLVPITPAHTPEASAQIYTIEPSATGLTKEQAHNIDLGLHYDGDKFHLDANLFYNQIDQFIYQQNLGLFSEQLEHKYQHDENHGHETNLPIYAYQQQDANLYGYELSGHYELNRHWHIGAFSDYTRAKFKHGQGNIPRIPSARVGAHLNYISAIWDSKISYTYQLKQNKITADEEETAGFGQLSVNINYYPEQWAGRGFGDDIAIYFKADNITNQLGFAHNSFIKGSAPLPGRNFSLGLRVQF